MTDGRARSATCRHTLSGLGTEELSEHLRSAADAAITDYQTQLMAALTEQQPDLSSLTGSLREIQTDAVRSVSSYTDQMHEVLRAVRDR